MTKKPETIERFRITCETDTSQVGGVLAELSRRGITKVAYEVVTDVLRYKYNNKAPKKASKKASKAKTAASGKRYGIANLDLVLSFAKKQKGQFTLLQVRKLMAKHGRPESSASPVCQKLIAQKHLRRLAEGLYASSTAKLNGNAASTEAVANG